MPGGQRVDRARTHALVLGASVAGLCAAQALAGFYDTVTVLDRDCLPTEPAPRRGVPQGSQLHVLLARGARDLSLLFPGLLRDLAAAGVPVMADFSTMHANVGGHIQRRDVDVGHAMYLSSRPFLEHSLRDHLAAPVTIHQNAEVVALLGDAARITGARVRSVGRTEDMTADLVVDATGRSGRCITWLAELGVPAPAEERLEVDIAYTAGYVSMHPPGDDVCFILAATPQRPWGLGMLRQENDRWIINAYGYREHHPGNDHSALMDLATSVAPEHWRESLIGARWDGPTVCTRYPRSLRRRYDKLTGHPDGLLVLGDALCSFNPIYGQGMTVAALQALALRDCLADSGDRLQRRFHAAIRRDMDTVWRLGAGGDLRFASVPGPRPAHLRVLNRYVDALQATTVTNPGVARTFWRVNFLLDPPHRLFAPCVLAAVAGRRPRRARANDVGALSDDVQSMPHAGD